MGVQEGVRAWGQSAYHYDVIRKELAWEHQGRSWPVLEAARAHGVTPVQLHLVLDGRSSPPQGAADLLQVLEREASDRADWDVATAIGRGLVLDRSGSYAEKTRVAYMALTYGWGEIF